MNVLSRCSLVFLFAGTTLSCKGSDKKAEPSPQVTGAPQKQAQSSSAKSSVAKIADNKSVKGWPKNTLNSFFDGSTLAYNADEQAVILARPTPEQTIEVYKTMLYQYNTKDDRIVTVLGAAASPAELTSDAGIKKSLETSVPIASKDLNYTIDPDSEDVRGPKSFKLGKRNVSFAKQTLSIDWSPDKSLKKRKLDGGGVATPVPSRTFVVNKGTMGIVIVALVGDAHTWEDPEFFVLVEAPAPDYNDLQEFNGVGDGLDD